MIYSETVLIPFSTTVLWIPFSALPERLSKTCPARNAEKTYHDFKKDGLLGCPGCYEAFREKLRPAFQHMQGAHRYEGDEPKKAEVKEESPELTDLRNKLSKLVADENYEEAAKVRDEIHKLEEEGKGGTSK